MSEVAVYNISTHTHVSKQVSFFLPQVSAHFSACVFLYLPPHIFLSLSFSPLLHQTQKATLWSNLEATLPLSLRSFFLLSAVAATLD